MREQLLITGIMPLYGGKGVGALRFSFALLMTVTFQEEALLKREDALLQREDALFQKEERKEDKAISLYRALLIPVSTIGFISVRFILHDKRVLSPAS